MQHLGSNNANGISVKCALKKYVSSGHDFRVVSDAVARSLCVSFPFAGYRGGFTA